jgi:hypothetical protein
MRCYDVRTKIVPESPQHNLGLLPFLGLLCHHLASLDLLSRPASFGSPSPASTSLTPLRTWIHLDNGWQTHLYLTAVQALMDDSLYPCGRREAIARSLYCRKGVSLRWVPGTTIRTDTIELEEIPCVFHVAS